MQGPAWIPVEQSKVGPTYVQYDVYSRVECITPLREYLQKLIANTSRLCRIWLLVDGNRKCVYWYKDGILSEF